MSTLSQSASILRQEPGINGIYKMIELAGRTCYRSENNITENSAEDFTNRMISSGHTAMLEHGAVYLKFSKIHLKKAWKYFLNPYSKITSKGLYFYVSTNYRVLVENKWLDDLKYISECTEYHSRRISFRCITNLQVSHELVRHRKFSFAQESSRYCNYSKSKFGGHISFIKPEWFIENNEVPDKHTKDLQDLWYMTAKRISKAYRYSIQGGWSAQYAAQYLPKATKTTIIVTAFEEDLEHFFNLRLLGTTGNPHPQMKELANKMYSSLLEEKMNS